jgi:hypothetical protein
MHFQYMLLTILFAEKKRATSCAKVAFNRIRIVVDSHMYDEIMIWQKFAAVDALQFVWFVGFVTLTYVSLQIVLRFKVKTALVAVFALNYFTLVFNSHVATQIHAIGTLPVDAINAMELTSVQFLVVLFF